MMGERLAEIRARAEAATPGPWRWKGNKHSHSICLFRARAWGDVVMAFFRWGVQSAQPRFVVDGVIVKPQWRMGPSHHPWEIVGIDHPDAIFIERSREDIDYLLPVAERAWALLAAWYRDGHNADCDSCEAAIALLDALTPELGDDERAALVDRLVSGEG